MGNCATSSSRLDKANEQDNTSNSANRSTEEFQQQQQQQQQQGNDDQQGGEGVSHGVEGNHEKATSDGHYGRTSGYRSGLGISKVKHAEAKKRHYRLIKTLGRGAYSKVYLSERASDGLRVALKAVYKNRLKPSELASLYRETNILASIHHPHVIRYIEHFEDEHMLYIVTELVEGGELFDRICENEFYHEADVRKVMKTLLETLKFCHDQGIVHRDLKPENILLVNKHDDSTIKLADFGFAKRITSGSALKTACGTPGYVAPEILNNHESGYDHRVDIWSAGVLCYILLCGYPPFRAKNRRNLYKQIRAANFQFDSPWWDPVSPEAKDFVSCMLRVNPDERMPIDQLLDHPFMHSDQVHNITPTLQELKQFNAQRKVLLLRNTWKAASRFMHLAKRTKTPRPPAASSSSSSSSQQQDNGSNQTQIDSEYTSTEALKAV